MTPTEMQSSRRLPSVVLTTKPSVRFETLRFHSESPGWMFETALPGSTDISRMARGVQYDLGSEHVSQSSGHVMRAQATVGIVTAGGGAYIPTSRP